MATFDDMSLRDIRRDLHAHPEAGWKEYRTTALVAESLETLGYEVHLGGDALDLEARMGVPSEEELASARARALEEGAPKSYLDRMDGTTGIVAERRFGDGPTSGVRIDLDALERTEAADDDHRPYREGFASRHPNEMHACGHDGHAAIGLGLAREFADGDGFDGTLKLFFQPAEEGLRGGKAMSRTDHLADVDGLVALHLGLGRKTGEITAGLDRPFASAKVDARFQGASAHAGGEPEAGRNALQAAAAAITNLYGLPRDSRGHTRVNVGHVESPNAQNIIAEDVSLRYEVRSDDTGVNERLLADASRILEGAALMHDVSVSESTFGKAPTFEADDAMVEAVADAAASVRGVEAVAERERLGASEDASYLIRRVQEEGGVGTYVGLGASNAAGHHQPRFDIDEAAIEIGVGVVAETIRRL